LCHPPVTMADFMGRVLTFQGFPKGVKIVKLLGEGGFAFVYEGVDLKTNHSVCVKRAIVATDGRAESIAREEATLLSRLNGKPGIVTYLGSDFCGQGRMREAYLVMEYCSKGHLFGILSQMQQSKKSYDVPTAVKLMTQVATSVQVLHSLNPPIAHRDLKLENILVTQDNRLKLCDFGSCSIGPKSLATPSERSQQEELIAKNTTLAYRPPEMCDLYSAQVLTEAVDIWALGCLFFTMLNLVHPFQEAGTLGILSGNWRATLPHGRMEPQYEIFEQLFDRMFVKVVDARASIDEVMDCLGAISVRRPLPPRPQHKLEAAAKAAAEEEELAKMRQLKAEQAAATHSGPQIPSKQFADVSKEVKSNSAAGRRKMLREGGGGGGGQTTAPSPTATASNVDSFSADFGAMSFPPSSTSTATPAVNTASSDPFSVPALPVMGKEFSDMGSGVSANDGFGSFAPAPVPANDGFDDGFGSFAAPPTKTSDGFGSDGFDAFSTPAPTPAPVPVAAPVAPPTSGFTDPFASSDPFGGGGSNTDPFSVPPTSAPNDPFAATTAPSTASSSEGPAPPLSRFTAFNSGRGADLGDFGGNSSSSGGGGGAPKKDLMSDLYSANKLDVTSNSSPQKHSLKQTVNVMSAFGNMGHQQQPQFNMQQAQPQFNTQQQQPQYNMQQGQPQFNMQQGQPQFNMQQQPPPPPPSNPFNF